jgi:hypothetical protein
MNEDSWGFYSNCSELEEKTNTLEKALIAIASAESQLKQRTIKYDWYQSMYLEIQKALKYRDDVLCDILTERLNYALRVTYTNFWVIKKIDEPSSSDSDGESNLENNAGELKFLFVEIIKEFVEDLYYDLEDYMFEDDLPVKKRPRDLLGHTLSRTLRVQKAVQMLCGSLEDE